ncbi:MAG: serine/threonine-protein kinase [Planctomycetota bacterium]
MSQVAYELPGQPSEQPDDRFVQVALQQRLLKGQHAEHILEYSKKESVSVSDAALALSLLEPHEVDAIELLVHPKQLIPGFELLGLLGSGAGGFVFRARQDALQRDVAIKTIITSARSSTLRQARMQREAHAIARLQHPHIVTVYDSGYFRGRYCIAMELVDGETLTQLIQRHSQLSEYVTWQIARQVASALAHASQTDIVHRDIKPGNILLTNAPSGIQMEAGIPFVKVVDFGLAFSSDQTDSDQITATGTTLGTPAYVAPEQLQDPHVDERADIYSLGATVFHMLAGHPPMSDRSPMQAILHKSIGDDRWRDQFPDSLSAGTVALFQEMTEADPERRTGNYLDLMNRIDEVIRELKVADDISSQPTDHGLKLSVPERFNVVKTKRSWTRPGLLLATAVIFALIPVFLKGSPASDSSANVTWITDGLPYSLFDGFNVPIEFQESGTWIPIVASDGSRVLAGQSGGRLRIPMRFRGSDSSNTRIRLGVHFPAESQFMVSTVSDSPNVNEMNLLQLTATRATPLSDLRPSPSAVEGVDFEPSQPEDVVFQRLEISRQRGQIVINVNGDLFGTVRVNDAEHTTLRFESTRGTVHLADFDIVQLIPESPELSTSPDVR